MSQYLKEEIILSVNLFNQAITRTCDDSAEGNAFLVVSLIVGILTMSIVYWLQPTTDWKVSIGMCLFITLIVMSPALPSKPDIYLEIYQKPIRAAQRWCPYDGQPIGLTPLLDPTNSFFDDFYNTSVSRGLIGNELTHFVAISIIRGLKLLSIKNVSV